jgi:hypothetical protein
VPSRTWAFQLMSWRIVGGCARRRGRCRRPVAGSRDAQAPATRARRAWVWPVCGSAPWRRFSPVADAAGIRPKPCMSGLGVATRVRSPRAATRVTAPGHGTPRRAWRASTPGCKRQDCTGAWRAGARRWRRSGWSFTARTSAGPTIGGAGVGQTTSASHRRWAGPQVARPVARLSGLSRHACRRHWAACRSRMTSSRARRRSRMASSSTVGTSTGVRSPERSSRARCTASRRWVCTRSPALFGRHEGAPTQHPYPGFVRDR